MIEQPWDVLDKKKYQKILGKKLRRIREIQKKKRPEIAENADTTDKYLGAIERGEKMPSTYVFHKLKEALGFSSDEFLEEIEKETGIKDD